MSNHTDYSPGDGLAQINENHPDGTIHLVKELDDFQRQTRLFLKDDKAGLASILTNPYPNTLSSIKPMRGAHVDRPTAQGFGGLWYSTDRKALYMDIDDGAGGGEWVNLTLSFEEGAAGQILRSGGPGADPTFDDITFPSLATAYIFHKVLDGSDGGGVTGGVWETRPITSIPRSGGIITTGQIATNQFQFVEAGTYGFRAVALASPYTNGAVLRFYNHTDSREIERGLFHQHRGSGDPEVMHIEVTGYVDIVASGDDDANSNGVGDNFEVQQYSVSSRANDGMGNPRGGQDINTYMVMQVIKIA